MTRDDFIRAMTPSLTAMRAKMAKRDQLDVAFVAGAVFDMVTLCGYELRKKPPAPLHSTPAPQTQKGPPA